MSSNIRVSRVCEECKQSFIGKTTVTRFCSRSCNGKNLKRRINTLKIDGSDRQSKRILEAPVHEIGKKPYLTLDNTCKLLNVSRTTLWRLIKQKIIYTYEIGGRRIIKRVEVDNLFTSNERKS